MRGYTSSWNDNQQGIINNHVWWWPMRGPEKQSLQLGNQWGVGEMCQGMAWWWGEKFWLKDVMETRSSECGFVCNQSKYENIWVKGLLVWQRCHVGKGERLTYSLCLSVCSKEKKTSSLGGGHVRRVVLLYLVNLDGICEVDLPFMNM